MNWLLMPLPLEHIPISWNEESKIPDHSRGEAEIGRIVGHGDETSVSLESRNSGESQHGVCNPHKDPPYEYPRNWGKLTPSGV